MGMVLTLMKGSSFIRDAMATVIASVAGGFAWQARNLFATRLRCPSSIKLLATHAMVTRSFKTVRFISKITCNLARASHFLVNSLLSLH